MSAVWWVLRVPLAPLRGWSRASQARATDNARAGATRCSQGRAEREEVAAYLRQRATTRDGAAVMP